jgi:lipoprotein-anchoring transpeptidase ErfK/SrfK
VASSDRQVIEAHQAMQTTSKIVHVSIPDQLLRVKEGDAVLQSYPISSSQFGIGTEEGSMKTPTGRFRIAEKIGADAPLGTVFRSRLPIGPAETADAGEDLVLSRILWLDGIEDHNANTLDRFIYIHGTNQEERIGEPASHGCIRMRNSDLVQLFESVDVDTPVVIEA